jgi:hypothetical protein
MKACVQWATESYDQCTEYADQGYNSCADWDSRCCTWWPCSWACKLITWVCVTWTWISNVVCVAWTTIVTAVCVLWEVIQIVLVPIAFVIELILSIPVIGRLIDEILNVFNEIFWRLVGLGDAVLTAIGITPLKKMRVCIVILRDERGRPVTSEAALQADITAAQTIFRDEADVEMIVEDIHTVEGNTPAYALDVNCNLGAWGEDLGLPGTYFQATSAWYCAKGALGRINGLTNQIVVFCVRQIPGGTAGCALGPLTDYLTIEGPNPICLAHEIAHKTGLWHCCDGTNLANGICGGTQLDWWQRVIVRNSRFVTYL